MQNMNLFEFVGIELDPVYQKIKLLNVGETLVIDDVNISYGKYYEVESEIEHVPFQDVLSCYRHVSDILVKRVSG